MNARTPIELAMHRALSLLVLIMKEHTYVLAYTKTHPLTFRWLLFSHFHNSRLKWFHFMVKNNMCRI